MNEFDVSVYAIRRRPARRRPFEVRWQAAGRARSKSFITVRIFAIRRRPGRRVFEVRWRVASHDKWLRTTVRPIARTATDSVRRRQRTARTRR